MIKMASMERFIMCCILLMYAASDRLSVFAQEDVTLASNNSCANSSDTCYPGQKADGEITTLLEDSDLVTSMTIELVENTTISTIAAANETIVTNTTTTNTSEVTNTSTTVEPTTEPVSNTTDAAREESTRVFDDLCLCDLTMNACDINCCCDEDCSSDDRTVFSECFRQPSRPWDARYCHQSQLVYHNNTELRVERTRDGLFCILQDNLQSDVGHRDRPVVTLPGEFQRLRSSARSYSWPTHVSQPRPFIAVKQHKAGELMWSLRNTTLQLFAVPTQAAGSLCQASKPVHFLRDLTTCCSRTAPTAGDCQLDANYDAASYYKNWSIISTSDGVNDTQRTFTPEDCANTSCVQVTPFLCPAAVLDRSDLAACSEATDVPRPRLDKTTCRNVMRQIRYVVHHNGTQGITNVSAYITLTSIPESPQEQFLQNFLVEFVWACGEDVTHVRSGRPGYLVGKPILAGVKVKNPTSKEQNVTSKEAIKLSNDPNDWLGLPAVMPNGLCHASRRNPVTFGEDRRSVCLLPLGMSDFSTGYNCELVQKRVLALLAGAVAEQRVFVGTYGDSRVEEAGDWVQVVLEAAPPAARAHGQALCKGMVTSAHLDVVFAHVGALASPQAKILGVALRFGTQHDLRATSSVKHHQLITSVSFLDVTQPALTHFAEPPVYEVKLPYDFFYPFFSSSVAPRCSNCLMLMTLIMFPCLHL